jgi:flagellar biosynthesis/type III secretory pathway protein FliH
LTGLLPFTPYLKGGGKAEIREASEILIDEIEKPQEQAEMLFLLAILAGRKYKTAGFQLLSPTTMMNIESLRDDPTAHQLIQILFPDELAAAKAEGEAQGEARGKAEGEARGIQEGMKKATEDFIHHFGSVLSEEQIKQLKDKIN